MHKMGLTRSSNPQVLGQDVSQMVSQKLGRSASATAFEKFPLMDLPKTRARCERMI